MDDYIARANIDHYLDLLRNDDMPPGRRSVVAKLLIEEENKLGQNLEQLEFAETRAAACRDRVNRLKRLRDSFAEGSAGHSQADGLLQSFEGVLNQIEDFCRHMRKKVEAGGL
jgi:hypothetical protein